jgi:hypothetical protein
MPAGVALRENDLSSPKLHHSSGDSWRLEKRLRIESGHLVVPILTLV